MSPKMKNPVNIKVNGVLVLFDVLKVLEAGIETAYFNNFATPFKTSTKYCISL